jgi:protoheme IX farnesyltransferase
LVTTTFGYFLAGRGIESWLQLWVLLVGMGAACGGSAALNHYFERELDGLMNRTRERPIPSGLIPANNAMLFGVVLTLLGVLLLWWRVNLLTAFLALLAAFLYVFVYTPMKKISWLNTMVGAIPGAIPPIGGWAASQGELSVEAWVLFGILFFWQHPHFYAIAWMFREEYGQAGFKMLPVIHPDGRSTFLLIKITTWILLAVSALPVYFGSLSMVYLVGALLGGFFLLKKGNVLALSKSKDDARGLLKATVLYLPFLLVLTVFDVIFLTAIA